MKLQNERLLVEFADPQTNHNRRFDRTAVATQVVLDGKYAFCMPEQVQPARRSTGGVGLCGEFVLSDAAEEAKAGEWFAKPGVGLVQQTEDGAAYDMWKPYEIRPFGVTAQASAEEIAFRQQAAPCGGYAVDIEKVFRLQDHRLILDITVHNAGEKPCALQEYQHNFVSLEGMEIGEGYVLDLPCDKALAQIEGQTLRQGDEIILPSAVRVEGNSVLWKTDMRERIVYHRSEEIDPASPHCWTLRHLRSGVSVSEETSFAPRRIDVWAVEHCVCAELYQSVRLAPGEKASWRRSWRFDIRNA